jgi:anti-anti-sigma factor
VSDRPSLLLRPTGPLDADSCGQLRQQLAGAFSVGVTSLAVDLSAVTTVDLVGLGVLAGAARHLRRYDGLLVVINAPSHVAASLRMNGMGELLEVPASVPLRVVAGSGSGSGAGSRPPVRRLTVVRPGA